VTDKPDDTDNAIRDARLAALETAVLALLGAGVSNSGIGPTAQALREAIEQARMKK